MYEDSWYSFGDITATSIRPAQTNGPRHRRTESLLQQPNGANSAPVDVAEPLGNVFEQIEDTNTPPEPELLRRAASYSSFYDVGKRPIPLEENLRQKKSARKERQWEALMLVSQPSGSSPQEESGELASQDSLENQLLEASQQEYLLYRDQLMLTERHLDGLIDDANSTLKLLTTLSTSFKSVEAQTSSFQSQCEDLLSEQNRLQKLADEVGTDLFYYAYLDTATRRLNAPGAGRLVEGDDLGEIVDNIDACIVFMEEHELYRDRDSYLARYNALLTKALHLLDHGFTSRLEKVMAEIGRQVSATQSESARYALAYGRFEEMILESYALIPNVQRVVRRAYDQYGRPIEEPRDMSTYANSADGIFRTYLTTRDRELKVMTQHDLTEYQKEVKSLTAETASRNFIKQCFERAFNEDSIFTRVFNLEPTWSNSPDSVFQAIKAVNTSMVHPGHLTPLGNALKSQLQTAGLKATCNVTGWLANEYSVADFDDDESPFFRKCREYAARLLVDHLWPFADSLFEAEIAKTISKATMQDSALKIAPVEGGIASSNAYHLVKQAIELLAKFDQAMPKERSSKNSAVVFKIVRETIQVLQRAEARIKSLKSGTDADLFMVKNLLIMKNELVSLEIGDIRGQASSSMEHFGQIWDTLSPQNWVNFFSGVVGGSLWSRGAPSITAKTLTVEDMSEQLDELLRQSIYAFTKRWATLINDSRDRKAGIKPIAKVEADLENTLQTAFSNQPEVILKLKEAIELNSRAQKDAKDGLKGARRY